MPTTSEPATSEPTLPPPTPPATSTTVPTQTTTTTEPAIMLSATAAASAVPAPTCFVSAGMRQGARGPAARCLETRLVQLGYALNGPDDVFDSTGAAALRQFQQASRIPVTGAAGPSVLKRLRIWRAVSAPVCSTPWGVRVGDVGFPARCVESRLRQLGYNNLTPDDRFDAASTAALKDFQN
ncbi:MAG: peptidoglycan-binding domain-containing protein, partial [Acidimicrobiales bacterium]